MTRKSKPWAIIVSAPGGPVRTEHSSQVKAYEHGIAEREAILDGTSPAYKIRVEQWEPGPDRWAHYEDIHPNS